MSLARKNSILSKTINVDHSANGDTLFIPHSGIVNISGILTATSGNFSSQTGNTIAGFDGSKNIVSLPTSTYPSFTELSYVKGVTSSIQTQIDTKAATSTTITAGSGLAGGGSLAANRTIDIGQGDGITVSADSIAVDSTVIRTTGVQTMSGAKTFSAQTVFASGTAASPGISIVGDTDTGIAQLIRGGESANTLSLVVGGTERMRIEPGNVKILTPTDDTAEFSISNSIDRDAYVIIDGGSNAGRSAVLEGRANGAQEWYICSTRFHEDGPNNGMALNVAGSNPMTFRTNNTEKMRITSGGNVGIGTSSPAAGAVVVSRSASTGAVADIPAIVLTNRNSTNATFVAGGVFSNTFRDVADPHYSAGMWFVRAPFSGNYSSSGDIVFGTGENVVQSAFPTERMRITSGGNVGIGTATVSYRLHVVANASATNNITTFLNNTGGTRSRLAFQDTAVSYAPDMGSVGNSLTFDTVGVERVRIDAGGNVGIGVTPAASTTSNVQASGDITLYGASRSFLGNLYFQSGWKYAGTGHGWGWIEGSGNVDFARTSSSGTAGNTATLTTAIRINSNSEVLIGTTTDNGAYLLQVNSQIYATNATIATSDARFKTNVEPLTDATAVIAALRPVAFDFIPHAERNFATERQVGLIAQEAQSALAGTDYADSVVAQCGDHLGLAYEKLVPVLIKALQESNARIAALEQRINA